MTKFFPVLILFFGSVALAQGATTAGDGGHAVACDLHYEYSHSSLHNTYKVELLDLFEARHMFNIPVWETELARETDNDVLEDGPCRFLGARKKELEKTIHLPELSNAFTRACNLARSIQFADTLPETPDYGTIQTDIPKSCSIVQVGVHFFRAGREVVYLDRYWAQFLSDRELAAFLLHETLHGYFTKAKSTLPIRQVVAYVMAYKSFRDRNVSIIKRVIETQQPAKFLR